MSTNGSLSLAEIMNQLAVLNGDAANLSVLEEVGTNPVAVVDELPAEPSLQLEAEDLKLDLGAADADEDDDHAGTVQGWTDLPQNDEWIEAAVQVWGSSPQDRPAEEIVEEVVEEAGPQKEFTIIDEDDDVVDKAYSREMITNDGNDEEIDIAEEQNDDGIEEIELDLGSADAQEDDEEQIAAAVEVEDFEDEAALRAALDDEAAAAVDEPAVATAVEEVAIPAPLDPSDRSFIDIDQALEDSIREPSVFVPEFSEISDVQFSERTAPIWGPGIDVDNYSTAADSTIASFNELSGLGPAVLASTVAQVIPQQTTEIQIETPAFEVPSEIEPAVESLVTSVVEPVVEPEFRVEPGTIETLVIEQPAEVVVTQVVETPAAIVEEVKDVQELKEEIAQDKADIAKAAPEVSAGIQSAIEDKVEEIADKQDEIVVLQQEIAAAQTATETPAVIAEKQEELLEAKLDIADKIEEVGELQNLAQEQAAILAEPAPVVSTKDTLRVSKIFVPRTSAAPVIVSTPEPILEFKPEETVQLLKFSVAEKIASGVNTAGNIARQFNSQLGANLVYVPTTETGPQMQQMFASLSGLNASQLSQLTALNIQPEQQRVYREMTQIPTRALKQKKAQLDLFEDKVRRFQTLVYQPASSTVTQKFRPRVQRPPQSSNLDARRPAVSVPRMPGWVK